MTQSFDERFDLLSHDEKTQFLKDINYYCRKYHTTRDSRRDVEMELLDRNPILLIQLATLRREDAKAAAYAANKEKRVAARNERIRSAWPLEKQRGSRTKWEDLVPPDVAERQVEWERRRTAVRLKGTGFTLSKIGQALGVSAGRVAQMLAKQAHTSRSPVEIYQDQQTAFTAPAHVRRTVSKLHSPNVQRDWLLVAS